MEENIPQQEMNKVEKEFSLSSWAVDNKTTVWVILAILVLGGVLSYQGMPKENFPEVITPEIYVGTPYPGNSPEDIEKLITRPLEKEINAISGIDKMTSTSVEGYSTITVTFDFDVTPSEALRKVKDKVDIVKSSPEFPADLPADPNIFEMNFSELVPIMNINLSGDYSLDELKVYAEYLEDKIEDVPEINKVDIRGVMEKEMAVELDNLRMEAMQISIGDVASAIQYENMTISGGDLIQDDFRRSVRVVGEFKDADELANIIIKREKGNIVYLSDIATVEFKEKEKESYAREYGTPVVSLDVIKRAGENLLDASAQINAIVEAAKEERLPKNLSVTITNDQSDATETQVSELINSIIFGVLLVVGVLLFFLGLRNAAFVGIAIPLSMAMSFMILGAAGVTLNVMVLFSLVLALGMLVDNGIVVVENVYRLMEQGKKGDEAAKKGVGEIAWPIIASTATTLAAFTPLLIWPGMMGEFMKFLPITLMIVLGSSLFVALVINPMLTARYMKIGAVQTNKRRAGIIALVLVIIGAGIAIPSHFANQANPTQDLGGLVAFGNVLLFGGLFALLNVFVLTGAATRFQEGFLPRLENFYEKFLKTVVRGSRPTLITAGTFVFLILSGILYSAFPSKVLFFPENEPQYLNVFVELPIGTDIEKTNRIAQDIEEIVSTTVADELFQKDDPKNPTGQAEEFLVSSVIGQVGNGTSDPAQGPSMSNTPNKARVTVSFVKFQERRGVATNDVLDKVRKNLASYPGVNVTVSKNEAGPPQGAPINIELAGENYDSLLYYADAMKTFINAKNVSGIEELKLDVDKAKPEMPIIIDRDKARRMSLSTGQIGDALRTALFGKEVSRYKDGEDDYPINIRFNEETRRNADAILDQRITFRDQATGRINQVPISSVATAEKSSTFSAVKRKDLDRVITISSNVLGDANPNEVVAEIKSVLTDFETPDDINFSFTGQQEEQAKEMEFLGGALFIAVFLIILIIVAQFNSISTPLIIGASVVFSLTGVFLGLMISRMDFVIIMSMIGIISLAGVVVNNAIVLIDYTNLIRERKKAELGMGKDEHLPFNEVISSVIEGGKTRLRPVLLTAITTILGLVPLAVGLNIDFVGFFQTYDAAIYVGGDNVMFWGPMSWTIIYGLTFATFLTLIVVPAMYLILAKLKYKWVFKV